MKIFCLIPAFNEKGNLQHLIEGLFKIIPKYSPEYKIFFVIQGNDGSIGILKKLKLKYKNLDWVYYPKALGIGRAYKIGFNKIDDNFTHVLTLDADLNHDPAVLPDFIKEMKKTKADLVIGSRFVRGGIFADRRPWKRLISSLMNRLMTKLTGISIHYISSGYRLMTREVIENIRNELRETGYPNYMELIIKTVRHGFKLSEVPIVYKSRVWGKSKMGKLKTLYDYLGFLPRILITS